MKYKGIELEGLDKKVKPSDVVIAKETCTEGIYYRVRKTVGNGDWFSVTSF